MSYGRIQIRFTTMNLPEYTLITSLKGIINIDKDL